jgi:peptidoglycan LD-endopeptidase CwlK
MVRAPSLYLGGSWFESRHAHKVLHFTNQRDGVPTSAVPGSSPGRRTMEKELEAIIDSEMTVAQALAQNPALACPAEILSAQRLLVVEYFGFDEVLHRGQIVMHEDLAEDVRELFKLIKEHRFPIRSVIPVADPRFEWDDDRSMAANNSSGFNYRTIAGQKNLSWHAHGRAIDLNTVQNPYFRENLVLPPGAVYDLEAKGTIGGNSFIVRFLEERGWEWGGRWDDRKDYQHFEKHWSP